MTNAYLPMTAVEKEAMLQKIGVNSFNDLIADIPKEIRSEKLDLGDSLSEFEIERELDALAKRYGADKKWNSFLGGGVYDHYIPATVNALSSRGEYLTAYTPYQPEASQGTLQVIYEYQTMISNLMGMDVSNASHYDGATSLAESALIALQHTRRNKVLVSKAVHPEYREVLKTYLAPFGAETIEIEISASGQTNLTSLQKEMSQEIACFISQSPNFFGVIEDYSNFSPAIKEFGALFILVANPMSMGLIKTPGEWGADIACGEGQPLGIPAQFGGPFLGFMTAKKTLLRKLPGRLAGQTVDTDGKRSFVLTLQAREQHIRRQRASSNICTNQGLFMLRACIYMVALGEEGLKQVAKINYENMQYLIDQIKQLSLIEFPYAGPVFNEVVLRLKEPADVFISKCKKENLLPGVSLSRYFDDQPNDLLVCTTEVKTKEDIDAFVSLLKA